METNLHRAERRGAVQANPTHEQSLSGDQNGSSVIGAVGTERDEVFLIDAAECRRRATILDAQLILRTGRPLVSAPL